MKTKIDKSRPDMVKVFPKSDLPTLALYKITPLIRVLDAFDIYNITKHNSLETSVEYNIKEFSKKIQDLKDIGAIIVK